MFSAVIEPLGLILRFTAHPDTQPLEDFQILLADDDGEVGLTVPETGQLPLGKVRQRVGQAEIARVSSTSSVWSRGLR